MESFLSIEKNATAETLIERSRFITHVFYAETEEKTRGYLDKIKKEYSDATHNCYAYVTDFGLSTKSSDDGEPSGTAGAPIMEVIKNKKLINVLVVVTRYFGGIKLGAGGLIRAYSASAKEGILKAVEKEYFVCDIFKVKLKYDELNVFKKEILPVCFLTENTVYDEGVTITVAVKKSGYKPFIDKFKAVFYDKTPEKIGEEYY